MCASKAAYYRANQEATAMWEISIRTGGRNLVRRATVTVRCRRSIAGPEIQFRISFDLHAWPSAELGTWPVIAPQDAEVYATARGTETFLGYANPLPGEGMSPSDGDSTRELTFALSMTDAALARLEAVRDGGEISFKLMVGAVPVQCREHSRVMRGEVRATVPRDEWVSVLRSAGFCETIVIELPVRVGGSTELADSHARVASAMSARDEGRHADAMAKCRAALEALPQGGFGNKAPSTIAQFLQERAGKLTNVERCAALQAALRLFMSPAVHGAVAEDTFAREDSELAIAMTASLVRLARRWAEVR